jgi:hypothetical protein
MPWWLDINQIFDHFLNWVTTSILNCFDAIFNMIAKGLLITPDVTGLPQVQALSGKSVWVVDTVFVLAFIAAGALTITAGGDERARYTAKDLAPRLVVGFIAAHFSQVFAGQAITLANGLTDAFTPGDTNRQGALDAIKAHVHSGNGSNAALLMPVIVAIITVLLATTMFGLLVRVSVLLVLCAAAPFALACHALPQTDPVARLWWRSFFGCLAIPVLQSFTLQAGGWMLEDQSHMLPALGLPVDPFGFINLFIVMVLLWTTVKIPGLVRRYVTQSGRTPNFLGMIVRVVIVQQLTRGLSRGIGPGAGRAARVVTR